MSRLEPSAFLSECQSLLQQKDVDEVCVRRMLSSSYFAALSFSWDYLKSKGITNFSRNNESSHKKFGDFCMRDTKLRIRETLLWLGRIAADYNIETSARVYSRGESEKFKFKKVEVEDSLKACSELVNRLQSLY